MILVADVGHMFQRKGFTISAFTMSISGAQPSKTVSSTRHRLSEAQPNENVSLVCNEQGAKVASTELGAW